MIEKSKSVSLVFSRPLLCFSVSSFPTLTIHFYPTSFKNYTYICKFHDILNNYKTFRDKNCRTASVRVAQKKKHFTVFFKSRGRISIYVLYTKLLALVFNNLGIFLKFPSVTAIPKNRNG